MWIIQNEDGTERVLSPQEEQERIEQLFPMELKSLDGVVFGERGNIERLTIPD